MATESNLNPCDGCGKCCETLDTPPFNVTFKAGTDTLSPTDDEPPDYQRWRSMPFALQQQVIEATDNPTRPYGSPCIWYDATAKRCRHYEHRPEVCRTFTPGEPSCNEMRVELGLPKLPEVEESW